MNSIVALLKTALLLLTLAQGPNIPKSLHDQAVSVANQAIAVATQALASSGQSSGSSQATAQTTAPSNSGTVPPPSISSAPPSVESGWDYNLTKRCIKSPSPGAANFYSDLTDCGTQNKNWTIAVESGKTLGSSDTGPHSQSLPINQPGSPLTLQWLPHTDELGRKNYSVNLKTDLSTMTHPGGGGYYTWYALMDHIDNNGGPLPRPDKISTSVFAGYNDFIPNGESRGFIAWQGWWDGASHAIEIDFSTSANWGDANPDKDIIATGYPTLPAGYDSYITMDGTAITDGSVIGMSNFTKGPAQQITVDWGKLIQTLIARGYMKAPKTGWENSATQAIFVGTEAKNEAASGSVVADLWVTNLRIETKK